MSQNILDSSLYWQADSHSLLRHGGHPDGEMQWTSSGDNSIIYCGNLTHFLLENPEIAKIYISTESIVSV
jgi:hypothetical protein